jgi:hypothetical protein
MLPDLATTIGTSQVPPAVRPGVSADAGAKPQISAAALANLRADVLLRLIETLLKHLPATGGPDANRNLLETLLAAIKSLPGRDSENGRKLAGLIAKLPPELRPGVEKLIATVLSAVPTRALVEIVRNPNGAEAQKLAHLIAASLPHEDGAESPAATAGRQQKPLALTAQQLAAVARHGSEQASQLEKTTVSDARALQSALKRIFDQDGTRPGAIAARAAEPAAARQAADASALAARIDAATTAQTRVAGAETRVAAEPFAGAAEAAVEQDGAEETVAAKRETPPARGETANTAGRALARGVLHAVARDVPPALLMAAVAQLVAGLSPDEAKYLRALLERPFEPGMAEPDAGIIDIDLSLADDSAPELAEGDGAADDARQASVTEDGDGAAGPDDSPELALTQPKARTETAQTAALPTRQVAEQDELPTTRLPEGARPATTADGMPDALPATAVLREGVPLAFVPYLPAEEDVDWHEGAEKDETKDDDEATNEEGDRGEEAGAESDDEAAAEEPEGADMARRREKTADMVGVTEPGLVFYQKLGDYWT